MTRQKAIEAYRRVKDWETRESARLRETILVPIFGGNMCVLHNSMLDAKQGRPWAGMPLDYPSKGRYYEYRQRQIWDTSNRLQNAFAKYF